MLFLSPSDGEEHFLFEQELHQRGLKKKVPQDGTFFCPSPLTFEFAGVTS